MKMSKKETTKADKPILEPAANIATPAAPGQSPPDMALIRKTYPGERDEPADTPSGGVPDDDAAEPSGTDASESHAGERDEPADTPSGGVPAAPLGRVRSIALRLLPALMLTLSAFCLAYWAACTLAAGPAISALIVWPAASLFFALCFLWFAGLFPFAGLRRKKWLRRLAALTLASLFCLFGVIEGLIIHGMGEEGGEGLDYIIVLGAHVRGSVPSAPLAWRIERAYEYLRDNPDTLAVLSGGQGAGEDISEAECMRRELIALGIDGGRLLLEERSTSTAENISLSLEIIGEGGAGIGIVTNNFHVWRALRIARRAGIGEAEGIAAPFKNLLLPHYMVREFFSILFNSLTGNM